MKPTRAHATGRRRGLLLASLPTLLLLLAGREAIALQDEKPAPAPNPAPAPAPAPAPDAKPPQGGPVEKPQLPPGVGVTDGARIEYAVGSQDFDFGNLTQGAVATHTFELVAGGTEDLVIKNVKPTCGCTVAQVKIADDKGEMQIYNFGDVIPRGRKLQVPATLHTKNKYGKANTRINIFSNDPRGTIQLGLTAEIEAFFNLNPRFLNFGQLQLGEVQTQSATLDTAGNQPVKLELIDASQATTGIQTVLEPLNPDEAGRASRWKVTVTVGPDLLEGNFARSLTLQSDIEVPSGGDEHVHDHEHAPGEDHTHDAEGQVPAPGGAPVDPSARPADGSGTPPAPAPLPEGHTADDGHDHGPATAHPANPVKQFFQAQLTVNAQVVGPFTFSPNYLSMGLVRPGQVVTRTIRIESHDPAYKFTGRELPTRLMGLPVQKGEGYQAWDQAKYFATVVRPVEGKEAVDVELRLDGLPEDAIGSFRGTLIVELGHEDKKEIVLTITGVCRGGPSPGRRPGGPGDGGM